MERFMPELVRQTAFRGQSQSGRDRIAKNLGYLSIALGLAELVAPKAICNAIGISGLDAIVRAYGAREIATGVAILTSHNPEPWIWARVAGDMADVATVATGLKKGNGKTDNNMLALSALAAVTVIDVVCASALGAEKGGRKTAITDYSDRTGFPGGLEAARGAARNINAAARA
jgi:hypothetical protein